MINLPSNCQVKKQNIASRTFQKYLFVTVICGKKFHLVFFRAWEQYHLFSNKTIDFLHYIIGRLS